MTELKLRDYLRIESRQRRQNCDKYYLFTMVLDCLTLSEAEGEKRVHSSVIIEYQNMFSTFSLMYKDSVALVNWWIKDMERIGLITIEPEGGGYYLSLTDDGRQAYKEQKYHILSADLLEAKRSRIIAYRAFIIAIISAGIAIAGILLNGCS